jgi:hypothetical protein
MKNFEVGNKVIGKVEKCKGKSGEVIQVVKKRRGQDIVVRWESGVEETVSPRSIDKKGVQQPVLAPRARMRVVAPVDAGSTQDTDSDSSYEQSEWEESDSEDEIEGQEDERFVYNRDSVFK